LRSSRRPTAPRVLGAARAAESTGDRLKASEYFGKLVNLAKNADTERQEIREAKAYSHETIP